jgi:hypothetical protein
VWSGNTGVLAVWLTSHYACTHVHIQHPSTDAHAWAVCRQGAFLTEVSSSYIINNTTPLTMLGCLKDMTRSTSLEMAAAVVLSC